MITVTSIVTKTVNVYVTEAYEDAATDTCKAVYTSSTQTSSASFSSAIGSAIMSAQSAFSTLNGTAAYAATSEKSSEFLQNAIPYAVYGAGAVGLLTAGVYYGYNKLYSAGQQPVARNLSPTSPPAPAMNQIRYNLERAESPDGPWKPPKWQKKFEDRKVGSGKRTRQGPDYRNVRRALGPARCFGPPPSPPAAPTPMPIPSPEPQLPPKPTPHRRILQLRKSSPKTPGPPRSPSSPKTALGKEYSKAMDELAKKGILKGPLVSAAFQATKEKFEAAGISFIDGSPVEDGHYSRSEKKKGKRRAEEEPEDDLRSTRKSARLAGLKK